MRAQSPDFAEDCARHLPAPRFTVNVLPLNVRLDTDHTIAEINRFDPAPYPITVLGVTIYKLGPSIHWNMQTYKPANTDMYCGSPQVDITVDLNPWVYIASEFPRGSCAYQAIYEHEQKHVTVLRSFVYWSNAEMASDVEKLLGRNFLIGTSEADLTRNMRDFAQRNILGRIKGWDANERKLQKQIDTQEEYARVAALCSQFATLSPRPASW